MALEETNRGEIDLTEQEWVEEVKKLSIKSESNDICVQILWSFGHLRSTGFLPEITDGTLNILLQRQSTSGSADGLVNISIPKPHQGHYKKQVSESGETCLTMFYPLGAPPNVVDWVEVRLATNWEFLDLLSAEAPVQ